MISPLSWSPLQRAAAALAIAAAIGIGWAIPPLFTLENITQVLRQAAVMGIIASGVTFVVISGRLDLSVGSLLSLCAVIAITAHERISPAAAIIAPLLVGAAIGCINGLLVAVLRFNSLITTLGMLSVLQGLALIYTDGQTVLLTQSEITVFSVMGRGYLLGVPVPIIVLMGVAILLTVVLRFTTFGQRLFAVGGNETASAYSAINTKLIIFSAYVIAGLATGVAAIVLSARVMAAQNDSGAGYELSVLSGIILGGTSLLGGSGGVLRSIGGIVALGFIQNALLLLGLPYYSQWIVTWAIIIFAVWFDLALKRGSVLA